MDNYDDSFDIFSDCYKDAYGFRPRWGGVVEWWGTLTQAERDAEFAEMQAMIDADEAAWEAAEAERAAEAAYQALVDAPTALQAALDADDAPAYDAPGVRLRARRYGKDAGRPFPKRLLSCACTRCQGRTWKRFRATQYKARRIG